MSDDRYAPPSSIDEVAGSSGHGGVGGVTFDQLPGPEKWRFFWGYFWRRLVAALLASLAGGVVGGILGGIIGGIGAALGHSQAHVLLAAQIVGAIVGGIIGLIAFWQLIRWVFRVRWFGYRLRLVRDAT